MLELNVTNNNSVLKFIYMYVCMLYLKTISCNKQNIIKPKTLYPLIITFRYNTHAKPIKRVLYRLQLNNIYSFKM